MSAKSSVILHEGEARKDNTDIPQGPSIAASRTVSPDLRQNYTKGEVESEVHEEVCYDLTSLLSHSSRSLGNMIRSEVWDNGRGSIKLDQRGFINMGPLSGDFLFNMEACRM